MATATVGIREFRDKLSTYLLDSEAPVTITRHGDAVGLYIPIRRKRTAAERLAFDEAAAIWQKQLDASGFTEDDFLADFKKWRKRQ
jgi:antitoxin (DNA-binding transcriptional repressor) of toxin-antitoxin stability system